MSLAPIPPPAAYYKYHRVPTFTVISILISTNKNYAIGENTFSERLRDDIEHPLK